MITHSAKETGRQKEKGVGSDKEVKEGGRGGWGGQDLNIGVGNIGGLHKIRGLVPLCQLCKETLKISHPPSITAIF